jgi:hypothetical protein
MAASCSGSGQISVDAPTNSSVGIDVVGGGHYEATPCFESGVACVPVYEGQALTTSSFSLVRDPDGSIDLRPGPS